MISGVEKDGNSGQASEIKNKSSIDDLNEWILKTERLLGKKTPEERRLQRIKTPVQRRSEPSARTFATNYTMFNGHPYEIRHFDRNPGNGEAERGRGPERPEPPADRDETVKPSSHAGLRGA